MKKTKLFTSIAALALVLGLGACETTSEEETTPSESETTTETTDTSESTPTTPSEDPDGYVLVGDFIDSNWDSKVDTSSKYYIPLGSTEYKQTVTIAAEPDYGTYDPWDAGLRVVEWGDSWNLVVGSDDLAAGSAEGLYGDDSKNIKVSWGETYDITVTFGDTNSILVTVHEDGENEGGEVPTLLGFDVSGVNYYIDGTTQSEGNYRGEITANIDEAIPVNCTEAEGDGYYLTFELDNTTYYVCIIANGTYINLQYTTVPNAIYYDESLDGWVNQDGTYFLCYNATYKCAYASKIEEYGPNGTSGTSPVAHLYEYPTIEGIALSADSTEVAETQSLRIDVTYTPSTIGASDLEWESSDNDVATVEDGRVTGVAASDTPVTITATTKNGLTATIDITVTTYTIPEGLIGSYEFENARRTSNSSSVTTSAVDTFFKTEGVYVAGNTATNPYVSCSQATKIGLGADGSGGLLESHNCFKLGTGSAIGEAILTFSESVSKVVVYATAWNASNTAGTLVINDVSYSMTQTAAQLTDVSEIIPTTYTLTSAATTLDFATVANAYRVCIYAIELYSK